MVRGARRDHATDHLGRGERTADRDRPGLDRLEPGAGGRGGEVDLVGGRDDVHRFARAADLEDHRDQHRDQADRQDHSLQDVGHGVGEEATERGVPDREERGQRDRQVDVDRARGRDHLAERPDLRSRPEHRARDQQHGGETLDASTEPHAEEIRERGELAVPEWLGEEGPHEDQTEPVAERLRRRERDPIAVDRRRRADHRLGAEPGREDREGREHVTELPAANQIVGLGVDALGDPDADPQLQDQEEEQRDQGRRQCARSARAIMGPEYRRCGQRRTGPRADPPRSAARHRRGRSSARRARGSPRASDPRRGAHEDRCRARSC